MGRQNKAKQSQEALSHLSSVVYATIEKSKATVMNSLSNQSVTVI